MNIKIYRTKNLSVVLYECETWSLKLKEEHKLMVPENRVLKRIFRPKRDEVIENGEDYITRNFTIFTPQHILFGDHMKKNEMGG